MIRRGTTRLSASHVISLICRPLQPKANRPPRGIPRPTGAHIECGRFHHIRPRYQRDEGDSAGVAGDASTNGKSQQESPGLLDVHRLLLCLFDANPHLTEGARESLAAAAALAKRNADFRGSKIILLCSGGESDELAEVRSGPGDGSQLPGVCLDDACRLPHPRLSG